jgi:ammonia channel protein AmtB
MAVFFSSYIFKNRRFDVVYTINGILGSLVGITGEFDLIEIWFNFLIVELELQIFASFL